VSRNSSVGIANDYGPEDRNSIPGEGREFFSSPPLGPTQSPIQWVLGGSFPGGKAAGA
jgi:hypothetical protein